MELEDVTTTGDSTEDDNNDAGNTSSSEAHLFMASHPTLSERDPTSNHHKDAYDLLSQGGDLYDAFTEKADGKNVWSRSDTASHILCNSLALVEKGVDNPDGLVKATEAAMNALAAHFDGETAHAMNLYDPDAEDIVDYVAQSDNVTSGDLVEELKERSSDDDSDE